MQTTIEYVEANGLRFAYLAEGAGPLVLLLHGFPDTAHTWDDVRSRLAAKGYRAVSPFMRGYHPTAVPAHDAGAEVLARDVLALIEALGASHAVLVGHDWGGLAALGAAALRPDLVRKLFAIAIPHPATFRPKLRKAWLARHFLAYKLPGAAARFARDDFAALPRICRRWSPTWDPSPQDLAATRACFSERASLDAAFGYYRTLSARTPAFLRTPIDTPSVIFAGLEDPLIERSDYDRGARMFQREYVIEALPGGHFLHRENPQAFADRLLAHL